MFYFFFYPQRLILVIAYLPILRKPSWLFNFFHVVLCELTCVFKTMDSNLCHYRVISCLVNFHSSKPRNIFSKVFLIKSYILIRYLITVSCDRHIAVPTSVITNPPPPHAFSQIMKPITFHRNSTQSLRPLQLYFSKAQQLPSLIKTSLTRFVVHFL